MNFELLKNFVDGLPAYTGIPGAEIAVWQEHKELLRHSVGVRDSETGEPMRGDELYFFYSATKPITCTAVMQLVERGILGLNDPVALYLPEFGEMRVRREDGSVTAAKRQISVSHLLTMTAGLNYNLQSEAILRVVRETGGKAPTREVARAIAEQTLSFEPGERWQYSLCHDVLAALVEVVSGMRFSAYVEKNIFSPLGMKRSTFHLPEERLSEMAAMYVYDEASGETRRVEKKNAYVLGCDYDSGGAGLVSCIDDYIRYTDAMANGGVGVTGARILQANTIDLMRENQVGGRMETDCTWPQLAGYGYGFGVRTLISRGKGGSLSPLGEFGWDGAKGFYLVIDPEHKLSLCYAEHRGSHKHLVHPRLRNLLYTCLND